MSFASVVRLGILCSACISPVAFGAVVFTEDFESYDTAGAAGYKRYGMGDNAWSWTSGGVSSTVVWGAGYAPGNPQTAGQGTKSAQLEWQSDYIQRSFATVAGETYLLSFLLGGYAPPGTGSVDVSIDGAAAFSFGPSSPSPVWDMHTLTFTAMGTSTSLRFTNSLGYPGSSQYTHLDAISVSNVIPTPATLALVAAAMAGLVTVGRKRAA